MLKLEIEYQNFDDETETDTVYFNLTKTELLELDMQGAQGLEKRVLAIQEAKNQGQLIAIFKEIMLMAYGVKSEDGRRFIKSDQLRLEFTQMPAYDVLFMRLAVDDEYAASFIQGIIPKDLDDFVEKTAEKLGTKARTESDGTKTEVQETEVQETGASTAEILAARAAQAEG